MMEEILCKTENCLFRLCIVGEIYHRVEVRAIREMNLKTDSLGVVRLALTPFELVTLLHDPAQTNKIQRVTDR